MNTQLFGLALEKMETEMVYIPSLVIDNSYCY